MLEGYKKFIVYPYDDIGMLVKKILVECYGINEITILDGNLCKYNPEIKDIGWFKSVNCSEYIVFLATIDYKLHSQVKQNVIEYFPKGNIVELCNVDAEVLETKKEV